MKLLRCSAVVADLDELGDTDFTEVVDGGYRFRKAMPQSRQVFHNLGAPSVFVVDRRRPAGVCLASDWFRFAARNADVLDTTAPSKRPPWIASGD